MKNYLKSYFNKWDPSWALYSGCVWWPWLGHHHPGGPAEQGHCVTLVPAWSLSHQCCRVVSHHQPALCVPISRPSSRHWRNQRPIISSCKKKIHPRQLTQPLTPEKSRNLYHQYIVSCCIGRTHTSVSGHVECHGTSQTFNTHIEGQ